MGDRLAVPLSCLTHPAFCQRLGSRPPRCSAQFGYPGGMLATGQRNRTEKKEVAVTYTILFYRATVPVEFRLPQPASQKFSGPFPLTMAPPMTLDWGLGDRLLCCQPSVLVCWGAVLVSAKSFFHLKVLALRL